MATDTDRYTVISSDGHVGADVQGYRPYLESAWHDEFDSWSGTFHNPFEELFRTTDGSANWDSDARLAALDAHGVVAEVLFPNTVPPFFASTSFFTEAPEDPSSTTSVNGLALGLTIVGCSTSAEQVPGRRAGVAQIMVNDVDDASSRRSTWVSKVGLKGGVLSGVAPDSGSAAALLACLRADLGPLRGARRRHQPPRAARPHPNTATTPCRGCSLSSRSKMRVPPDALAPRLRQACSNGTATSPS